MGLTAGPPELGADQRLREAALALAGLGWRVFPLLPGSKRPLTRHGVKDASTDAREIVRWWDHWPEANVGVATGHPGPQVLDVDDQTKFNLFEAVETAPTVATARGRHYYFAGRRRGTVALGYGELRGLGSYVVAPPSIHPGGREYVWLLAPSGPLPPVPSIVNDKSRTAGRGEHEAPAEPIPHGHRHPYLADFTVRLVRAGVTDRRRLLAHLRVEFELACAPVPPPTPGYFEGLADWAIKCRIAEHERGRAQALARQREQRPGDHWWRAS